LQRVSHHHCFMRGIYKRFFLPQSAFFVFRTSFKIKNPGNVGSVGDLHVLVYIIGFPNIVDNNSIHHYHHPRVTGYGPRRATPLLLHCLLVCQFSSSILALYSLRFIHQILSPIIPTSPHFPSSLLQVIHSALLSSNRNALMHCYSNRSYSRQL
jgi:hypothetical protein